MRNTFKVKGQKQDFNYFAKRLGEEKKKLPEGATALTATLTYEAATQAFANLDLVSCAQHLKRLEDMRYHDNKL